MVYVESSAAGRTRGLAFPELEEIRSESQSLAEISAFITVPATLAERDLAPDRVTVSYVSPETIHLGRDQPTLGRDFRAGRRSPKRTGGGR